MEGGKRAEEAGPSSGGSSSACGGVAADHKEEKQKATSENPIEVHGVEEEEEGEEDHDDDVRDDGAVAGFVPGPLVSLKEQIEKDKVCSSFLLLYCLSRPLLKKMNPVSFHNADGCNKLGNFIFVCMVLNSFMPLSA